MTNYKLKLEIFEGPLDLLLYLIKKNDIDIKDIPIVSITEQYMQYIEMMKMLDLEIVGDFLVMAATLMHIKSRMLLPPDPVEVDEQEEDPRDELARRLMEYKRFKEIAEELQEKEQEMKKFFPRVVDEDERKKLHNDSREIYIDASLFDLITAFSEALRKVPEQVIHEIITEEFTVEGKRDEIRHLLLEQNAFNLTQVFSRARNKEEVIVTFLAVLELIRQQEIRIVQQETFSDIEVIRNVNNVTPIIQEELEEQQSSAAVEPEETEYTETTEEIVTPTDNDQK